MALPGPTGLDQRRRSRRCPRPPPPGVRPDAAPTTATHGRAGGLGACRPRRPPPCPRSEEKSSRPSPVTTRSAAATAASRPERVGDQRGATDASGPEPASGRSRGRRRHRRPARSGRRPPLAAHVGQPSLQRSTTSARSAPFCGRERPGAPRPAPSSGLSTSVATTRSTSARPASVERLDDRLGRRRWTRAADPDDDPLAPDASAASQQRRPARRWTRPGARRGRRRGRARSTWRPRGRRVRTVALDDEQLEPAAGRRAGRSSHTRTAVVPVAAASASRNPGPPSDIGASDHARRPGRHVAPARRMSAAAASAAVSVPANLSGATRTRTASCRAVRRGCPRARGGRSACVFRVASSEVRQRPESMSNCHPCSWQVRTPSSTSPKRARSAPRCGQCRCTRWSPNRHISCDSRSVSSQSST